MTTIPPGALDALSRAMELALAHPALLAAVALLLAGGFTWTFRPAAPAEMVARQITEADQARRSS
ncbi:hypothetical protein ABZ249_29835 [Nocardiopsis sp. NPDC006139]|uniref:hypothetical protein n=1 Tax=Nocardiopsis sp. NPDC006139 TaxID=3154578 RepID=UPI0033A7860F